MAQPPKKKSARIFKVSTQLILFHFVSGIIWAQLVDGGGSNREHQRARHGELSRRQSLPNHSIRHHRNSFLVSTLKFLN
jgi:hypothetical protein